MSSRTLVFGATSAIAHATARLWAERGHALCLVGRSQDKLDGVLADLQVRAGSAGRVVAIRADLDDVAAHPALMDAAVQALGGLDLVLIAHGTLPDNERCAQDVNLTLREMVTNGLSAVSLSTLAAQRFEAQGHGSLAVITSVAGDRGRQSNHTYGAAKGMVSLFLQGLRNRLQPKGIQVLTIKPGFVDTPMTAHIKKGGPLWASPQQIAAGIVKAVDRKKDVVYLPGFWRLIMTIIRLIPEPVFKRLKL
ncbi:SDR family oxidoreductase [Aquabacterium sp. J223]|uniref:SDR family oxidoreductase n=1 Tax=Aquabacterium sp. J223 TaxID=2898431 RepID=UPI0021ADA923|nr:SDR family oxidoreductase [Aquabacterium sp. J223]UUX95458.1 SDR family oxidoreductase [Aquabacterium sp. J223]